MFREVPHAFSIVWFPRMAHRVFRDAEGVEWQVWAVIPADVQGHLRSRSSVHRQFQAGWLAFLSATSRRRRMPIPPDWDMMPDEALVTELARSEPVRPPRRLIE